MTAPAMRDKPAAADLLRVATQRAGVSDFGSNWAPQSLDNLVAFLNDDATVDAAKRGEAYEQMIAILVTRLRLVDDRKRHPGIDGEKIVAPIIVMGFGRSGTTFLHSLIAEDPQNRSATYWETARPSPPPRLAGPDDPRPAEGDRDIQEWLDSIPGFITQHPYWDQGGSALMECESFLIYNLSHHYPIQESKIPYGGNWAVDLGEYSRYEFHQWFLQQLQYGGEARRWALKGVDHQFYLSGLRAVYPDALLVWAHRSPVEVMGSLLQVTFMLTKGTGGDAADVGTFTRGWLNRHRTNLDKAMANPLADDPAICHVRYPDLTADGIGTIRRVYGHFGLEVTAEHESRMRTWIDSPANKSDRHGRWTYELKQFGVSEDYINDLFSDYRERFDV